MSLLMKALRQAAQNRGEPATLPGDTPAPATADPAAAQDGARAVLPPGPPLPLSAGPEPQSPPAPSGSAATAAPGPLPGELSLEPLHRPAGGGPDSIGSPGSAASSIDLASAHWREWPAASRKIGTTTGARREPPPWNPPPADGTSEPEAGVRAATSRAAVPAGGRVSNGRGGAGHAAASPERAGAVLAAGAGAARASRLSGISRMQWVYGSAALAALLWAGYVYMQIAHPGLFQHGLRTAPPAAVSPLTGAPPATGAATAAGPSIAGSVGAGPGPGPGGAPAIDPGASGPAAVPGLPPVEGAAVIAGQAPAQGPVASASAPAMQAGPDIPSALLASPLLNPPAVDPATGAAAATITRPPAAAASALPARAVPAAAAAALSEPPAAAAARGALPGPSPLPAAPASRSDPGARAAAPAADSAIRVARGSTAAAVDPLLLEAYEHLQAGRLEAAQRRYQQVAAADPRNIDALLGLAALAQLGNQAEAATRHYLRVLELDPRNAHAQAALLGLLGRADPAAAESQLRQLLGREPSPFLYFTLGNLYADQNRWALAQQAFFQAHHLQPDNADYAFNLAVGLERIAQPRLALTYLKTAVGLAEAGARANFDIGAARLRMVQLEAATGAR